MSESEYGSTRHVIRLTGRLPRLVRVAVAVQESDDGSVYANGIVNGDGCVSGSLPFQAGKNGGGKPAADVDVGFRRRLSFLLTLALVLLVVVVR